MKTRITELFGTKHPIVLAAMAFVSSPKMVAAICNAGGLALFPTGVLTPEEARKAIREIKSLTDKPFGVNQVLASPSAKDNIDVILDEKVPVIEYVLGRPWFIKEAHAYGGKVIAKLSLMKHAARAEQLGVDVINITGFEAAGHPTQITSMVLIPLVAKTVKIPIIASGGIVDGRGLAAALLLGADGVAMGTRFAMTKESLLHNNWKQKILKATEQDTLYVDHGDPVSAMRALKTRKAEAEMKNKLPILQGIAGAFETRRLMKLSWGQLIRAGLAKDEEGMTMKGKLQFSASAARSQKVMLDGDEEAGLLTAGQVVGSINDVLTCQEVIEQTIAEAEEAMREAQVKFQK